jgi:hypothetical protein
MRTVVAVNAVVNFMGIPPEELLPLKPLARRDLTKIPQTVSGLVNVGREKKPRASRGVFFRIIRTSLNDRVLKSFQIAGRRDRLRDRLILANRRRPTSKTDMCQKSSTTALFFCIGALLKEAERKTSY